MSLPGPAQRYVPELSKGSLEWLFDRAKAARNAEDARYFLETPVATLARGGSPPDFVTADKAERTETVGSKPDEYQKSGDDEPDTRPGRITVRFKPHFFHVLDAMEDDISKAKSNVEFIWVYASYFPDSFLRFGHRRDFSVQMSNKPLGFTRLEKLGHFGVRYVTEDFDPGGVERAKVFVEASRRKINQNPSLSTDALAKALIEELVLHEAAIEAKEQAKPRTAGPCREQEVAPAGGNQAHNDFAKNVTGGTQDYKITTPDGEVCQTDGRDSMNPRIVWEVKTKHEWATGYGSIGAIFAPQVQMAINRIERQRQRCLNVTERCGYLYYYAFDTKETADDMRKLWNNRPPVFHR